jgi:fermentation-respiration switch protein FrsA (DUF1100 family)
MLKHNLHGLLALLLAMATSGCAVLGPYSPTATWERKGIFQPAKHPAGDWQPTTVLVQDAHFAAEDGTKLHGWYVRHPQPVGHALLLHGNAGNVTLLADTLRTLNRRHNLAVLALDYRGFGKSEGKPSEEGLYQDARAARKWLAQNDKIEESDVILMGVSLGGAVAVDLAANDGCRGLVLASTFTSLPDVAQHHLPWIPMQLSLSTRFNSLAKIKDYPGPLLLSHGDADEVVPYQHGLKLFEAATGPKRMITANGCKHNDQQPEEYRAALDQFLRELPPERGAGVQTAAAVAPSQAPELIGDTARTIDMRSASQE